MIKGIGIDIVENNRIAKIIKKNELRFINKVLSKSEIFQYNKFPIFKAKEIFLSSRWAVKEALVKAISNKYIIFNLVTINKEPNGKPLICIDKHNLDLNKSPYYYIQSEKEKLSKEKDLITNFNEINNIIDNKNLILQCSVSHEENYSIGLVIYSEIL